MKTAKLSTKAKFNVPSMVFVDRFYWGLLTNFSFLKD